MLRKTFAPLWARGTCAPSAEYWGLRRASAFSIIMTSMAGQYYIVHVPTGEMRVLLLADLQRHQPKLRHVQVKFYISSSETGVCFPFAW